MKRSWLQLLVLLLALGAFVQAAVESLHHDHGLGEHAACASCVVHASPAERPEAAVESLPPLPCHPYALLTRRGELPPPSLEPEDVSEATSPPRV